MIFKLYEIVGKNYVQDSSRLLFVKNDLLLVFLIFIPFEAAIKSPNAPTWYLSSMFLRKNGKERERLAMALVCNTSNDQKSRE